MTHSLEPAYQHFVQGMSHISHFWGFPKAMGAIYGAIYLSPEPISLDEIVDNVGVTKGAVSTNVRQLERLGMIHKHIELGSRKDFYYAETDFWQVVRGILKERQQSEFDRALNTVGESLSLVAEASGQDAELSAFYQERMGAMQSFFKTLDNLVGALMALESLISLGALRKMVETVNEDQDR